MSTFTQTISDAVNSCRWFRNETFQLYTTEVWSGNYGASGGIYGASDSACLFTNVTVPKGATITSAVFSLNVGIYGGSPVLQIRGEDADSPSALATMADGNARIRTTASVNPGYTGAGNKDVDVSTIVAEIFSRLGWDSGNNLQLFIEDNGSAAGDYINSSALATHARTLTIVYSQGWSHKIMGVSPAKVMGIPKANIAKIMTK